MGITMIQTNQHQFRGKGFSQMITGCLKQHANQMWCLALYLPLLVGEYIPEDDEHWELDHHEKFKGCFLIAPSSPKCIIWSICQEPYYSYCPLVRSWCMRYEAKHQYFKRLAVVTGNFINLPYTLSKRHQESLSCRLMSSEGSLTSFIEKGVHIGPGKHCYVGGVDYNELIEADNANTTPQTPVYEARWVIIHGLKYKVGATLHIGETENELPTFWEVIKIFVVNKYVRDIMFVVAAKETLHFYNHFQCYEVVTPARSQIKVAYLKDFSCILPLSQNKDLLKTYLYKI